MSIITKSSKIGIELLISRKVVDLEFSQLPYYELQRNKTSYIIFTFRQL